MFLPWEVLKVEKTLGFGDAAICCSLGFVGEAKVMG